MDYASLQSDLATSAVVVTASFALCYLGTYACTLYDAATGRPLGPAATWTQRVEAADLIVSVPLFPLLCVLALRGTYDLFMADTVAARWEGTTSCTYWFQVIYVTRMVLHLPLQCVTMAGKPQMLLQMTLHHVLSVICFGGGLFTGRLHFWAVFDGCCEVTTVFLNMLFAVKQLVPKDVSGVGAVTAVIGLSLWSSFVAFRLVLFPTWLWMFYCDVTAYPAETWDRSSAIERYLYPIVTVFLLGLSIVWFVPITKGMLKAIRGPKKSD